MQCLCLPPVEDILLGLFHRSSLPQSCPSLAPVLPERVRLGRMRLATWTADSGGRVDMVWGRLSTAGRAVRWLTVRVRARLHTHRYPLAAVCIILVAAL